jgi:hypothetical protein
MFPSHEVYFLLWGEPAINPDLTHSCLQKSDHHMDLKLENNFQSHWPFCSLVKHRRVDGKQQDVAQAMYNKISYL